MTDILKINPKTRISRNEEHVSAEIDGETVLMSIQNGKYYGMDDIGTRIWKLLSEPITFMELISILAKEFEGDMGQIRSNTQTFLRALKEERLIRFF